MLVELGLVEQRYRAVLEVLNDGATVVVRVVMAFSLEVDFRRPSYLNQPPRARVRFSPLLRGKNRGLAPRGWSPSAATR